VGVLVGKGPFTAPALSARSVEVEQVFSAHFIDL
jgi:hypothetical protein